MKFPHIGNKGQMGNLTSVGYGLMILGVVLGLAIVVLSEFRASDAVNASGDATGIVNDVISVFGDLADWLPIIIIVIVVAIILGLLGFAFGRGGAQ